MSGIELPESIPKAMFERELDYYGIPENDGSVVQWKKKTYKVWCPNREARALKDGLYLTWDTQASNSHLFTIKK